MTDRFAHLHVHSDYSILDGGGTIESYVERAAELGQPALALTDHGTLAGAYSLWKAANAANIIPLIGVEAYVAPNDATYKHPYFFGDPSIRQDDVSAGGKYLHITLIASNRTGLQNLYRLQYLGYRDGFYQKARIDLELLARYSEGIICLSGCPGGHISTLLRLGQTGEAWKIARRLREVFEERFFVEIMDHGTPMDEKLIPELLETADMLRIAAVATGDVHYCRAENADAHDTLLCVQSKSLKAAEKRFRFSGSGYHLASSEELVRTTLLPSWAMANTLRVVEMVEGYGDAFKPKLRLPNVPGDPGELLREEVKDGLEQLGLRTPEYLAAAANELAVIEAAGFSGYFVALSRVLRRGRARGIRFGPGRGSAAGSVVVYALGITQLDPLNNGLLFERFLNPERPNLPDIDIDIDDTRRDEFLAIVREEFGAENVAQVNTFATIGAKSAIRDSARALGIPYAEANELVEQLPPAKFGRAPTLAEFPTTYRKNLHVLETARQIEGLRRSAGIHASAVVVSPEPIIDVVPCRISNTGQGSLVAELTGDELAELGFVKWDFLGLTALGIIEHCLRLIGRPVNLDDALGDANAFQLLGSGDTAGLFQLDGSGMRRLLQRIRPQSIDAVAAVLALYRPGPMGADAHNEYADRKVGRRNIEYIHPEYRDSLSDILSETYGVIVFQEQVLKILNRVGDYTYSTAELIFNAMRKKDQEKMAAARPEFVRRLAEKKYSQEAIDTLWEVLVPFADYSFNKSHATSYAIIALWQAYLKAHYPWHFWAATLSAEKDPKKLPGYVKTVISEGVPILPPDINESGPSWTPTRHGVRYGLTAIKGISDATCRRIREAGPYTTLQDFLGRVPTVVLKKNTMEALVKAGCFDALEGRREALLDDLDGLLARALDVRGSKGKLWGTLQLQLFSTAQTMVRRRQVWEAEVLGVPLTQESISLKLSRRLTPNEWEFVYKTLLDHHGNSPVEITVGPLTKLRRYATVTPSPKLLKALEVVGITGSINI